MPKLGRKTPCAECPWLRKSIRGWLGDDTPEGFYRSAVTRENHHPCHSQIDYSDPDWETTQLPTADFCAGNFIYFKNHMKRPRDPELAAGVDAVESSRHVFQWPQEFIHHHSPDATEEEIKQTVSRAQWPYPSTFRK